MLSIRDFLSSKIKYKRGTLLYKSLNNKCGDFFLLLLRERLRVPKFYQKEQQILMTADRLIDGRGFISERDGQGPLSAR